MANGTFSQQDIKHLLNNYRQKLEAANIKINDIYVYGSYAKGTQHEYSDIDICVVSPDFQDRVESTMTLMKLRDDSELALSPIAFSQKTFVDENPLAWEIKQTGVIFK